MKRRLHDSMSESHIVSVHNKNYSNFINGSINWSFSSYGWLFGSLISIPCENVLINTFQPIIFIIWLMVMKRNCNYSFVCLLNSDYSPWWKCWFRSNVGKKSSLKIQSRDYHRFIKRFEMGNATIRVPWTGWLAVDWNIHFERVKILACFVIFTHSHECI